MPPTENQLRAARENAKKSTGPKTEEGKRNSSKNALKHGLTAKVHDIPLPGEDVEAIEAEVNEWLDFTNAHDNPLKRTLVERACSANQKLRRIDVHQRANAAERARSAQDEYDRHHYDRAMALGRRLFSDPVNRCEVGPLQVEDRAVHDAWLEDDPCNIAGELESFAIGAGWLLNAWLDKLKMLEDEGFWHYETKYHVIRMMGRRPENVLDDPVINDVFLACNVIHPGAWEFINDVIQTTRFCPGRTAYYVRIKLLEHQKPKTREDAVEILRQYCLKEIHRLTALKIQLDARYVADRDEAPLRALFDDSKASALLVRYETSLDRALRASVSELNKVMRDEAKAQKSEVVESAAVPTTPESSETPQKPRSRAPRQNEPPAPPVVSVPEAPYEPISASEVTLATPESVR